MARGNNQKGKILYIEKMLRNASKNHTVSMQTILTELEKVGIQAERKSVYDDMEVLRTFGLDVQFKRGKPGGYYLANVEKDADTQEEQLSFEDLLKEQKPERSSEETIVLSTDGADQKEEEESGYRGWHFGGSFQSGKQMKLSCSNEIREGIETLFGRNASYKEKEEGRFQVTVDLREDEQFYGWLTSMGTSVRIVKPKKTAQAYRDYLKSIAKEYKGI